MTPAEAAQQLKDFEKFSTFRPDIPAAHENWQKLVIQHQVSGKEAHDAGFVAAMQAHGVGKILTFSIGCDPSRAETSAARSVWLFSIP